MVSASLTQVAVVDRVVGVHGVGWGACVINASGGRHWWGWSMLVGCAWGDVSIINAGSGG